MNFKIRLLVGILPGMFFVTSCSNDTASTTPDKKDSSASQTSSMGKDTMSKMNDMATSNGLMSSMSAMVDKMATMKMTGDFDKDFAAMMIEHHQGAIDMSEQELKAGKDETMKSMANKIIAAQKEDISKLQDFLKNYKGSGMKHGEGELEKSMSNMKTKMSSIKMSGDVDKDFATMMSSHHQGAVVMAKMELANGMDSKLKQMAQKTIGDQTKEINEFANWLNKKK